MAATYEKIATVEVGSGGAANIEFTSIAADWTDLQLLFSLRGSPAYGSANVNIRFNGSSSSIYSSRLLYNVGGVGSALQTNQSAFVQLAITNGSGGTANSFGNGSLYIPNYASSNNKSVSAESVAENNDSTGLQYVGAGLFASSSAITSITLYPDSGTWLQYSSATLYGIKNS